MKLPNHLIETPINIQGTNILIVENIWLNAKEKDLYGPQMISELSRTSLDGFGLFGGLHNYKKNIILPLRRKLDFKK